MSAGTRAPYSRRVFVNVPYDTDYLPLLRALVFTVHACGFEARLAMLGGGAAVRLERIVELVRDCQFAIHDLSRVQLGGEDPLPRFNMPFECGLFYGALCFGPSRHRNKRFLLLESEPRRHQKTLSDLSGLDPRPHRNSVGGVISCVRDFLADHISPRPAGPSSISALYRDFANDLPRLAALGGLTMAEIEDLDRFGDWYGIATGWLAAKARG